MKTALELITEERERQITKEGYTPEHDLEHNREELALAAVCYAIPYDKEEITFVGMGTFNIVQELWPFTENIKSAYPDRIRDLVKAGALILAEIERLQNEKEN